MPGKNQNGKTQHRRSVQAAYYTINLPFFQAVGSTVHHVSPAKDLRELARIIREQRVFAHNLLRERGLRSRRFRSTPI